MLQRFVTLIVAVVVFGTVAVTFVDADELSPVFERDVQPILKAHCSKCHGEKVRRADLSFADYAAFRRGGESGELISPGEPDQSLLFEMIESDAMPPEDEDRLSAENIAVIRAWIKLGAKSLAHPVPAAVSVTYEDIVPLMFRRCVMCHGPEYQFGGVLTVGRS